MAAELQDKRASRAVLRLKATALRQVRGPLREPVQAFAADILKSKHYEDRVTSTKRVQVGDLRGALSALEETMLLSDALGDCSHDADVLGEIADTHADMGDFEKAGQVCFQAKACRFEDCNQY